MAYQRTKLSPGAIARFELMGEIREMVKAGRILEAAQVATSSKVKEGDLREFMPKALVHAGYFRMIGEEEKVRTIASAFYLREEDVAKEAQHQEDSKLRKAEYGIHFDPE